MGESVVVEGAKEVEEKEGEEGAMGGEGAVKLSTQFTQTALSARLEPLHCQTNEGEEEEGVAEGNDGVGERQGRRKEEDGQRTGR